MSVTVQLLFLCPVVLFCFHAWQCNGWDGEGIKDGMVDTWTGLLSLTGLYVQDHGLAG